MGNVIVMDGTPVGSRNLCKSCSWGQTTVGYRESEMVVVCGNLRPAWRVPFAVHKCTDYDDKRMPSYEQMEKLAIDFKPRASKKTRGFDFSIVSSPERPEFDVNEGGGGNSEDVDAVACSTMGFSSNDD